MYDSQLGRWLLRDPLGESMGTNLYAYVGNSPINAIDPLGLQYLPPRPAWVAAPQRVGPSTVASMGPINPVDAWASNAYAAVTDMASTAEAKSFAAVGQAAMMLPCGGGGGLPVLKVSRSQLPNIARNIENALAAGHPDLLTRGASSGANRAAALNGIPHVPGLSPDEFPFASTMEGGAGAWIGHVPISEQRMQGGLLNQFYTKNNLGVGGQFGVQVVP